MSTLSFTETVQKESEKIKVENYKVTNLDYLLDFEENNARVYTKSVISYLHYETLLWIRTLDHPYLVEKVSRGVLNMSLENMKRRNNERWMLLNLNNITKRFLEQEELLCPRYINNIFDNSENINIDMNININRISKINNNYKSNKYDNLGGIELTKYILGKIDDIDNITPINIKSSNELSDIECIFIKDGDIYVNDRWFRAIETNYVFMNDWKIKIELKNNIDQLLNKIKCLFDLGFNMLIVESRSIYKRYEDKDKNYISAINIKNNEELGNFIEHLLGKYI